MSLNMDSFFSHKLMRYHYEKPELYFSNYGKTYYCNHPAYSVCTLFEISGRGLSVIQQRYDRKTKHTWWTELDPWLTDRLYLHTGFYEYFNSLAREPVNDLYPTVTVRQIMWALKMKPLKREPWETTFDKKGF